MNYDATEANGYQEFLARKGFSAVGSGIDPDAARLPGQMFDFQRDVTRWALGTGRAAIFADCGLGKTIMQMAWAQAVCEQTDCRALILTPLAVAQQARAEGEKFGIDLERFDITNYQRLHHFDHADYGAIVLDESSILKSFAGQVRKDITAFMSHIPYRLLCTATAAPNDYTELGTSSEALGCMGYADVLATFFRPDNNNSSFQHRHFGMMPKWRLKGHAELPFWRWVCTWARALRKPSDMGYQDDGFELPALDVREHVVASPPPPGTLLPNLSTTLAEERADRRATIRERCEIMLSLVEAHDYSVMWCHLNDESAELARIVPDCVEVSGSMSDAEKEARLSAFARGDVRRLVTKPKIGAWGLNLQHCAHVATFTGHSYEQYYQSVRRCWRFGQTRPVTVDVVSTTSEGRVADNLARKAKAADAMFEALVSEMNSAADVGVDSAANGALLEVPAWLTTIK